MIPNNIQILQKKLHPIVVPPFVLHHLSSQHMLFISEIFLFLGHQDNISVFRTVEM